MSSKCGGCGKFLSGGATCTKCKEVFHKSCVNIISQTPKKWLCPGCVASMPRQHNTNSPIKIQGQHEEDGSLSPLNPGFIDYSQQALMAELRALRADMNNFRKDFGIFSEEIRKEINELRVLHQEFDKKMDSFSERLESQEIRLESQNGKLEAISKENGDLKVEISLLKRDLQQRDQLDLQNDLEISGVTENNGESVYHLIGILTAKLGVNIDERDIVDARRVGPRRMGQDGKQRPRPIMLRVARRAVREQVLRGARSRRGITTADIEIGGASRSIYINERLSKENRFLFSKARALCKQHNWKYAWTREGNILIRKADGETAFRVRDEKDFNRIFK